MQIPFGGMRKVLLPVVLTFLVFSPNAFSDEFVPDSQPKNQQPQAQEQRSFGFGASDSVPTTTQSSVQETRPRSLTGALGVDSIGIGPGYTWQVLPSFEFNSVYESNVNREAPGQEDHDIILNYTPAIEIARHGNRYQLEAGYAMNFQEYLRDPDQNAFNHDAYTRLKHTTGKLTTTLEEEFSFAKTYASTEQSERRRILSNSVTPEIAYRLSDKFSVSAIYQNYLFEYLDSILKDSSYIVHDIGGRIYYHLTPRLDLYAQGSGIINNYYRTDTFDSNGFRALGGLRGRITDKLTMTLESGFKHHDYESSGINSYNDWVLSGAAEYQVTSKLKGALFLRRDKEESVYRNVGWYEVDSVGANLNYQLTSRIAADLGTTVQGNYYAADTTEAGNMTDKRRDFVMASHVTLKWNPFRYFTFQSGYKFLQRQSNFDNLFEYVDHVVEASISLGFA